MAQNATDRHGEQPAAGVLVIGNAWPPYLRPGELAVIDPTDTTPQPGELFATGRHRINRDQTRVVQVHRLAPRTVAPGAVAFYHRLRRPGVMTLMDGPLCGESGSPVLGRVFGVVLAR